MVEVRKRNEVKEHFIAQYLTTTGAKIEDTELVEQRSKDGLTIAYWCRPRRPEGAPLNG
jgi:hypothetical protein